MVSYTQGERFFSAEDDQERCLAPRLNTIAVQWWCDLRTNEPVFSLNFDAPLTSLGLSAATSTSTLALTYANDVSFHPVVPNSSPSHTLNFFCTPPSD